MTYTIAELMACPFCECAPQPVPQNGYTPLRNGVGYYVYIWCENCGALGGERKTPEEAIAAWNRRTPISGYDPVTIEECAKVADQFQNNTGIAIADEIRNLSKQTGEGRE